MNLLRRIALAFVFALAPSAASAACGGAVPFVFTNVSSFVDATTTNANNAFLVSCANSVDNTQIGAAGLYASQLVPSTSTQATFGGPLGYTFAPSSLTSVPLTLLAPTGTSGDLFDIYLAATKVFSVDSTGATHLSNAAYNALTTGNLNLTAGTYPGPASIDDDTQGGINLNFKTGALYGLRTLTNGTPNGFQVGPGGGVTTSAAVINGPVSASSATVGGGITANALTANAVTAGIHYFTGGTYPGPASIADDAQGGINLNFTTGAAFGLRTLTNGGTNGFQVDPSGKLTAASATINGAVTGTSINSTGTLTRGTFPVITGPGGTTRIDPTTLGVPVAGGCNAPNTCGSASRGYAAGNFTAVYQCQVTSTNPGVAGLISFSTTGYTITSYAIYPQPSAITTNFYVLCVGT